MKRQLLHPLASLVVGLAAACGCSRTFYRQTADADAYCLVDPKAEVVGAAPSSYRIDIDPRSRMFDPNNPDLEPQPPDDPTSHRYMEVVDRKKGSKLWNELPRTAFVENPDWQQFLGRNDKGEVQLDMRGAAEMALVNSPQYQSELETLYLSRARRELRAVPIRHAILRRLKHLYYGRRQGPQWHGQFVDGVERLAAADRQPAPGAAAHRDGRRICRWRRQLASLAVCRAKRLHEHDAAGFHVSAAALARRRADAGAGAADHFRADAAGQCAADGALSTWILFERRHWPGRGAGALAARRLFRRQWS
jgi:hypothetical protein